MESKATKREAARLQKTIVVIVEVAEQSVWASDSHTSETRVKRRHTLRVIPSEKEVCALFQFQEGRSDHSEQRRLKASNKFDLGQLMKDTTVNGKETHE